MHGCFEQPVKLAMLFDHVGHRQFIHDEIFDVEEQAVFVLIQMVEPNGIFEPTLDSGKSDGSDGAIVVSASRWPSLQVFLIVVTSFAAASGIVPLHKC
jgi:hypothetical protein